MERELSLKQLQGKVAQFDAALRKVQRVSINLGTKDGPQRLKHGLTSLSELEASGRITQTVLIRREIITRTIPRLTIDRENIIRKIELHTENRLKANIELIRSLLGQGATQEELTSAEHLLLSYRTKKVSSDLPRVTPEIPDLTPLENRLLDIFWNTSKAETISGTELVMKFWGNEIRAGIITVAQAKDRLNTRKRALQKKISPDLTIVNTTSKDQNTKGVDSAYYLKRNPQEKSSQLQESIRKLKELSNSLTPEEIATLVIESPS